MTADLPRRPRAAAPLSLSGRPQWRSLQQHFGEIGRRHLRTPGLLAISGLLIPVRRK